MTSKEHKVKRAFSLTTTLALAFSLLCMVSLAISGLVQGLVVTGAQQEAIKNRQELIAREAKNAVSSFIQDKERLLITAVDLTNMGVSSRDRQRQVIDNLLALEPNGEVLASGSRLSRSDTQRFLGLLTGATAAAIKKESLYTSDVYIENLTGEPMMIISVPARDAFKDVRGILVTELGLKFMWDLMGTINVGANAASNTYVVDRQGALIAFRDVTRVLKGEKVDSLKAVAEFIRAPQSKTAADIWTYQGLTGETVVGTYLPLGSPDWAVVTEMPATEANREVTTIIGASTLTTVVMIIIAVIIGIIMARRLSAPLVKLTATAAAIAGGDMVHEARVTGSKEVIGLAKAFNSMTTQLRNKADSFRDANQILTEIVGTAKEIVLSLNSTAREIETAAQEQTTASNQHASGITEVNATLQELTITARQITTNVGELVLASEESIKTLKSSEQKLLVTVAQLDDAGAISRANTAQIGELGKRSVLINEMVELIKEVANKTNILSINASIEASRSGEAGSGFSVVAAEIRELSKETIDSAKKADKAAKEIQDFLNAIIVSSGHESAKVQESGATVKEISKAMGEVVGKINSNYSFTQKIDVSIKQQESGSVQAAETMRQMAEIARQSAEIARQTLTAVKDIVRLTVNLEGTVGKFSPAETSGSRA
jgi:methyl-accepting chemotaxis protein